MAESRSFSHLSLCVAFGVLAAAAATPMLAAQTAAELAARYGLTEEHVRAADALITAVFPGAHRDWYDEALVWPDGRREQLSLAGLNWVKAGSGWWLAAGVEFPQRLERESLRLRSEGAPAEAVRSRVVLARTDAEFRVLAQRVAEVDPDSPLNTVHHIEFQNLSGDGAWPELLVSGSSAGSSGGVALEVSWSGTLGGDGFVWTSRQPRAFTRQEPGGRVTHDLVGARVDERGRTTFRGVSSGELLPGSCDADCRMAPLALLEGARSR